MVAFAGLPIPAAARINNELIAVLLCFSLTDRHIVDSQSFTQKRLGLF
jgi:hypothetical protein